MSENMVDLKGVIRSEWGLNRYSTPGQKGLRNAKNPTGWVVNLNNLNGFDTYQNQ